VFQGRPFNISNFKVIKPLNYEKIFDHLWQYRIRQYCNVILAKVVARITVLVNILVFWSPLGCRYRYQHVGGNS